VASSDRCRRNPSTVASTTRSCPHRSTGCPIRAEYRRAFEIAVNRGINSTWGLAIVDDDIESHPVGKRRFHDAVEHGASFETVPFHRELAEPRPPRTERVELRHRGPHPFVVHRKGEGSLILDHIRRTSHDFTVTLPLVFVDRVKRRANSEASAAYFGHADE
jgi:hypothetical protein